jgi:hypothetical protein
VEASKGDKPAMKHTYLDQSIDDEPKVKVLIDADVVLELFINRRGFVEDFEKLLAEIETSPQVEMYVTNKCLKRIRLEEGLGENAALQIEEIFCGRVITISNAIRDEARTYRLPDFDSAEEVACAKNEQLNAIITLNPQNFDGSTLPIWSVANLLERVSLEKSLEKKCQIITQNPQNFDGATLPIWSIANVLKRILLKKSLEKKIQQQNLQKFFLQGSFVACTYFVGHSTQKELDIDILHWIKSSQEAHLLHGWGKNLDFCYSDRNKIVVHEVKYFEHKLYDYFLKCKTDDDSNKKE